MEEIKYYLLCYVIPIVIACFIFIRMFRLNKAKCKAFICSLVCRYIHGKVCDKEKALLFEQLKDHKSSLKTNSKFTILEIGVGSGMNFKFFPSECDVTCLDPNPYNEKYVIDSLRKANNNIRLVKFIEGYAENMLDVLSDSFDAVVCTFTMCSIKGLNDAIEEIRRVLKPGGKFFFLEHVAAHKGSHLRSLQDKFQRIWPYIAKDTHINRETWKFLDNSSFKDVQYHLFTAKFFLAFLAKPCMYGSATK
uniref:Methyltransferase type 11 domain-containing protein n=1 Tax=Biomphalaria glabrata TaxID=6526 RepID=A0A2C9KBA4_BIOGL